MKTSAKSLGSEKKIVTEISIDAKNVARTAFNDEPIKTEALRDLNNDRLEINIVVTTDQYQEVEIIYGDKKKRKRITKFLPINFANIIYPASPSGAMGALNLGNLSQNNSHLLQEKFLRILAKIYMVSEIKTSEKIWDSDERINTTEKAILLAVFNRLRPEEEKLDRIIISQRSHEISNQTAFKNFISDVIEMVKKPEKLFNILLGDQVEKFSSEKKSALLNCLKNIITTTEESKRRNQLNLLQTIINETSSKENFR